MMRSDDLETGEGDPLAVEVGELAREPAVRRAVELCQLRPAADLIIAWNDGGAVATDVATGGVTGNNQTNLAKAVAANYAAFAGKYKGFEDYLKKSGSANPFAGQEDKYIMFKRT